MSDKKFLTVNLFRNKCRVDIREFYDDGSGEKKPGKKGVNLADTEFKVIIDNIEKIAKKMKAISGEISDEESDGSD